MATMNRRIAGAKAKRNGQIFENLIQVMSNRYGFHCVRIPDGCKQLRGMIIRVATPFDFILAKKGKTIFLDAKSTKESTFSKSKMKRHQVEFLLPFEKNQTFAGYLVLFQKENQVVFFSASQLAAIKRGQAISISDGVKLGSMYDFNFAHLVDMV